MKLTSAAAEANYEKDGEKKQNMKNVKHIGIPNESLIRSISLLHRTLCYCFRTQVLH